MALQRPELSANANQPDAPSSNSPAAGKAIGFSFQDLLAHVTDDSPPSASHSDGGSSSWMKPLSKGAKPTSSTSADSAAKTVTSQYLSLSQTQFAQATPEITSPNATKLDQLALPAHPLTTSVSEDSPSNAPAVFDQSVTATSEKGDAPGPLSLSAPQAAANAVGSAGAGVSTDNQISASAMEADEESWATATAFPSACATETSGQSSAIHSSAGEAFDPGLGRTCQAAQPGNGTAKAEARHGSPSNSQGINADHVSPTLHSEGGSQTSSSNTSAHDSKHDDDGAAQTRSTSTWSVQDPGPAPISEGGFANIIASQFVAAGVGKAEGGPAGESQAPQLNAPASSTNSAIDVGQADSSVEADDATGTLHASRLITQTAQSQLHVGFQTGEFGKVDIRTSMVHSQLTAEISVEHSELRHLLAAELPQLQTKLAAHPLTSANVVLSNTADGGSSGSRNSYQRNGNRSSDSDPPPDESDPRRGLAEFMEAQVSTSQLDVHM